MKKFSLAPNAIRIVSGSGFRKLSGMPLVCNIKVKKKTFTASRMIVNL